MNSTSLARLDDDALWAAIDDQRRRTADLLQTLTDEQWAHPSLCPGSTVRDVAAHLSLQQIGARDLLGFLAAHPSVLRNVTLNQYIRRTAVLQARLPTDQIIDRIRGMIGSRRHNTFVTERETLIDILVHSQDIAVPLRLPLEVNRTGAAEAASRVWETRHTWLSRVFRTLPLDGYRYTATDIAWTAGEGPVVQGPIGALLLLLTGRTAVLPEMSGPGAEELRTQTLQVRLHPDTTEDAR